MKQRASVFTLVGLMMLVLAAPVMAAVPTVNTFTVAATAVSPVPVTAFTASDSDGTVVGYMITQTSTKPTAADARWTTTPGASFTTTSIGAITLFAWAKDNANGVSNSKTAPTTVVAGHNHTMTHVTGLTAALAAKADTAHNHDNTYQKKYANVIVVAKSGGDFTDPKAAVDSIVYSGNWPDNNFLVKIMPGIYDLGTTGYILMKPGVDVQGSGKNVTRIKGGYTGAAVINWQNPFFGAIPAELSDLTVEATAGNTALFAPYRLSNASIISSGIGVDASEYNTATFKNVDITAATGITCRSCSLVVQDTVINASATGIWLDFDGSLFNNIDVTAPYCLRSYSDDARFGTKINNSRFKVTAGGFKGMDLALPLCTIKLTNVVVDTAAAGAVPAIVTGGGTVDIFGGQYIGDLVHNTDYYTSNVNAASAQLTGNITVTDKKLFNCFNSSFDPIP